jgi:mannosylfructose-phosphate synthase
MTSRPVERMMMLSLHGYVSAHAELGLPDTGGQVVYVLELSASLARGGRKVDIFTRRFEGQPAIEQIAENVRIVRIAAGGPDLIRKEQMFEVVPEWVTGAEAFIRQDGLEYDLIDSHYWDAGLAGVGLSDRLGVPHIHTPHSIGSWKRDNLEGDPETLERQYNFARRIRDEKAIYAAADAVVATTPQQQRLLVGQPYAVEPRKVVVVTPGFDHARFFPVSSTKRDAIRRGLGVDGPLVLALGRIAFNKGYDLLIRAMPSVTERVPRARLRLAIGSTSPTEGEMRQVADLRRLAEGLGVGDHVEFADHIPDEALADTYRAADVFVLSSRYEPFGMTAIEAMACGTPTVVTTSGGLWEMLTWGAEALYATPSDATELGHAISTILRYQDVAGQLSMGGALLARAEFTWSQVARRLVGLLQEVREAPDPATASRSPRAPVKPADTGTKVRWAATASS